MNLKSLAILLGVAIIIVFIGGAFISLGSSSKPSTAPATAVLGTKPLVGVADIVGDPIVYNGLKVEVESQVLEWVTKKSFKVGTVPGAFGGGGVQLLVISQQPLSLPDANSAKKLGLGEKVNVHMKGRVIIVNKDQLKQYLGENFDSEEFKLDDNNLNGWTLGTILLLDSVEKI